MTERVIQLAHLPENRKCFDCGLAVHFLEQFSLILLFFFFFFLILSLFFVSIYFTNLSMHLAIYLCRSGTWNLRVSNLWWTSVFCLFIQMLLTFVCSPLHTVVALETVLRQSHSRTLQKKKQISSSVWEMK